MFRRLTTRVSSRNHLHRRLASSSSSKDTTITIITRLEDDTEYRLQAHTGQTLLEALDASDLSDVWEGGQCGGLCQCSTCRCIISPNWHDLLEDNQDTAQTFEETDMLESAAEQEEAQVDGSSEEFLTNARLSCQIELHAGLCRHRHSYFKSS